MTQPIKRFHITSLTVQGFKGYEESQTFHFGDMNTISGHMGTGKSSVADAIAFAVAGVPFFGGSRIDTLYHGSTRDAFVELCYTDETGPHVLSRRRVNDKMDVFLDEKKITQRELTIMFGEKDLFLSMINPLYFIEVLEDKGRDLLERYLPEIPKETVMAGLSDATRELLEGQQFLAAEALAQKTREELSGIERDLTYSQGQLDLLEQQVMDQSTALAAKKSTRNTVLQERDALESRRCAGFDSTQLEERRADLYARHEELLREPAETPDTAEIDREIQEATAAMARRKAETYQSQYAQHIAEATARIEGLRKEAARQKHILAGLKPGVQCQMCRQTVTEANLPEVRQEFQRSFQELCGQGKATTEQLAQLQEMDAKAKAVFEQYQADDVAAAEARLKELVNQRDQIVESARQANEARTRQAADLRSEIQNLEMDMESGMLSQEDAAELQRLREEAEGLSAEIDALDKQVRETLEKQEQLEEKLEQRRRGQKEKKELLTALKSYIARRVELVLSQLKMNRVTISLFDVVKTTGEVRDVFKFLYEGRPYRCISHSEKIRAGLEVTELVKRLVGVDYPVFIDDAESVPVIDNVLPSGQIFVARVVKGAQLSVQAVKAAPAKAA